MARRAVTGALLITLALSPAWACVARETQDAPSGDGRERAYRSNNLGVALLEQFNYDAAAAAFREALRVDPAVAIAHLNLSLALLYLPDLAGAAREATEAARLLPLAPQPPYVLGLVARAENRNAEARTFFERVRGMDPRDSGSATHLAQILLQERNYDEAIALLQPVVADEPTNVTALYNLGLALSRGGQPEEGRRMMDRSQTVRAGGYGTTLSNGYLEQGRYAEGIASTGAEPELVAAAASSAVFAPANLVAGPVTTGVAPSPFGRLFTADGLSGGGARGIAAGVGGGLTLVDVDRNGSLDLVVVSATAQRLWRNDGRGTFTDATSGSGLDTSPAQAVGLGCVAGDVDNDGLPDLFVLRYGASSLYHNDGNGRFSDVTARAGLTPYPFLAGAAALVDVDHDGDLDLVIAGLADLRSLPPGRARRFPDEFAAAPLRLQRNNGDGTFTDITRAAGLGVTTRATAIVPTDFDNRRDIDLLVVNRVGAPMLFKNQRDGTFRDVAREVGLAEAVHDADRITSVATGDTNKDDAPDFFFGRDGAAGLLVRSDGRGRFSVAAVDGSHDAAASQIFDYDNDGLADLVTWSAAGPRVTRNLGSRWVDVTAGAVPAGRPGSTGPPLSPRLLAVADINGDGTRDMLVGGPGGSVAVWRNSGDARNAFVRVPLRGRVSNRSGVGAKVQVRAGSLLERLEVSAATPAVAPADVLFGLGRRVGADVVRVLWPSGVLQAEYAGPAGPGVAPMVAPVPLAREIAIEELDRKPSSCPFLYTWNGHRFEFVTDFMGGGELGLWHPPGTVVAADPLEFVRIRGDQLRPKDGRYEIRVTNELEETLYVDRLQLLSIAHPAEVDVFPNEGLTDPPKPSRLFTVRNQRPVARALDHDGQDVTGRVARVDRQYPDGFALMPFRGYAAQHTLTLDLGPMTGPTALLLTGWTDYAFSSDNVAASHAGLSLSPPALQIKDATGVWRTALGDIGIPVGRPQTVVVDLSHLLRPGEHLVRISTNMRIYWDQILTAGITSGGELPRPLQPLTQQLRERGFSMPLRPDGHEPETYDYSQVSTRSPWKTMAGRFTRVGGVGPLLASTDDQFVVSKPGDEMVLSFDAAGEAPLPSGWTRTFLLMADGFSKEMDINSASPDHVEPLPFHGMTQYPPRSPESEPNRAARQQYRDRYNTRLSPPWLPRIEPVK